MNILSKDILPLKTSQKFSSVLEPYAGKVASTVLRRECHCEVMFLSDFIVKIKSFTFNFQMEQQHKKNLINIALLNKYFSVISR